MPSDTSHTIILGRALGQKLSELLGENVVPGNRAGAGGSPGISLAAKSPPEEIKIGMPVEVAYEDITAQIALVQFRAARK